jgi:hypothetical protein
MLYYADALPQYATKLLRLDAPVTGDIVADWEAWKTAKAEMWQPHTGWRPYSGAQAEILAKPRRGGRGPGQHARDLQKLPPRNDLGCPGFRRGVRGP